MYVMANAFPVSGSLS